MLIQVNARNQIINVHLEPMKGEMLKWLGREDREYVKGKVTDCVTELVEKFHLMYTERKQCQSKKTTSR